MHIDTFWAAWGPICDFRRRLEARIRRNRCLMETEQKRRSALQDALRCWVSATSARVWATLPLVLWWPVMELEEMFLSVSIAANGGRGAFWHTEEPEHQEAGYTLLALTNAPWVAPDDSE